MPSICRDRTARFGGSPMAMHRPDGDAPTEWGCTDRMGMHRRAIRRKESKRLTELRERKRLTGHWASRTSSR